MSASNMTSLPQADYDRLQTLHKNTQLKETLQRKYHLSFGPWDFDELVFSLTKFTQSAFSDEFNREEMRRSELEITKALDLIFSAIDKQRQYAVHDARRTGYEHFVLYSQRPFSNDESNARSAHFFAGRDPGPPGLCRDRFDKHPDTFGNLSYSSLGLRHGWLESLLREIRESMGHLAKGMGKRGPKGKWRPRWTLFHDLAKIFERCGGIVKAYKNPVTDSVEGEFVKFVGDLAHACPSAIDSYLSQGLGDAIIRWVHAGRPPPEGRIEVDLGNIPSGHK